MKFTKQQVFDKCALIAPQFGFSPQLIQAICQQESAKDKDGSYRPDIARLEQAYYSRYIEGKNEYATTSEVLLGCSYGVMQTMGLSLKELGYFEAWYKALSDGAWKRLLTSPYSQLSIASAIDAFCSDLDAQIRRGCELLDRKRKTANGMDDFRGEKDKTRMMLLLWNGGGNPQYDDEVLEKMGKL